MGVWTWLLLGGCATDGWCERFNFDCAVTTAVDRDVTDQDGDVWALPDDCDDLRADVYPGAPEACDGLDNDCDGETDEGLGELGYRDSDGDGYGDDDTTRWMCDGLLSGWSLISGDCDDASDQTHPGARERCDKADNDCDGDIDEDTLITVYTDGDGDGFGEDGTDQEVCFEAPPEGTAPIGGDCDDTSTLRTPGAPEVCFDEIDNDCDELVDEDGCEIVTAALYASAGPLYSADIRGDFDGDGTPDLAAGAPLVSFGSNYGVVYVLHGPIGNDAALNLTTGADSRLYNGGGSSNLGDAVAAVPDVDGDGYDELAVSARNSDEVLVFYAPLPESLSSTNYDMRIHDDGAARLGHRLSGRDDLSGDGLADLLIAREDNDDGAAVSILSVEELNVGIDHGSALTWATDWGAVPPPVGAGDLTGDGAADVLVTFDEQVYVVAGPITADAAISAAPTRVRSAGSDGFGAALAADDLDGDGYTDLLVGAPESSLGAERSGAAYLLLGPLSGSTDADAAAAAVITGEANFDRAGGSLITCDRDQDGLPDLVVSASGQYADFSANWSGTYTVLGPVSGTVSLTDAAARFQDTAAQRTHPLLASGADISGDGASDVLVRALYARGPGSSEGLYYVLPRTF